MLFQKLLRDFPVGQRPKKARPIAAFSGYRPAGASTLIKVLFHFLT